MAGVEGQPPPQISSMSKAQDGGTKPNLVKEHVPGSELWTDGLICAFELVKGHRKLVHHKSLPKIDLTHMKNQAARNGHRVVSPTPNEGGVVEIPGQAELGIDPFAVKDRPSHAGDVHDHKWVPIGWSRIAELSQRVQSDASWENENVPISDSEDDYTVADVVAPYWLRPGGPTWWFHVTAGHPSVDAWLGSAHWMHPAIRTALRDESRLISDRMKYLLYEVISILIVYAHFLPAILY